MREPRPKQQFPDGGKELYELLRLDHEPVFIWVLLADETEYPPVQRDTLLLDRAFDPMVYFWPVEGQHVVCRSAAPFEKNQKKRLVRALLRDGATWVSLLWHEGGSLEWKNHGDPTGFMVRRGYALDPLAVPGHGSRPD